MLSIKKCLLTLRDQWRNGLYCFTPPAYHSNKTRNHKIKTMTSGQQIKNSPSPTWEKNGLDKK